MSYTQKYLKYKSKYLNLKYKMRGGAAAIPNDINNRDMDPSKPQEALVDNERPPPGLPLLVRHNAVHNLQPVRQDNIEVDNENYQGPVEQHPLYRWWDRRPELPHIEVDDPSKR